MADDQVEIGITADASGVAPGAEAAKAELEGLSDMVQAMTASMAEMTAQMVAGLAGVREAIAGTQKEVEELVEEQEAGFAAMVASTREGLEAFEEFKGSISEFAELLIAAFAVEEITEFAKSLAENAEQTKHMSEQLNISVTQMQALEAVATGTGVSIESLSRGLEMMGRSIALSAGQSTAAGKALKELGITADDGRSDLEHMLTAAEGFQRLKSEGINAATVAMAAFGRGAMALVPVLEQGKEGIQELADEGAKYGMINGEAQESSLKLAEAINQSNMAWAGMKETIGGSLAPMFTSIAEGITHMVSAMTASYESGGAMRTIMDGLNASMSALGAVIGAVGTGISTLADNFPIALGAATALAVYLKGEMVAALVATSAQAFIASDAVLAMVAAFNEGGALAVMEAALDAIVVAMVEGTSAALAFTAALLTNPLVWVAAAAGACVTAIVEWVEHVKSAKDGWQAFGDGVRIITEGVKAEIASLTDAMMLASKITEDALTLNWGAIQGDWKAGTDQLVSDVQSAMSRIKQLVDDAKTHFTFGGGSEKPKEPSHVDLTGGAGQGANLQKPEKPKADKSRVDAWEADLEAQKTAFSMQQDAQGTFDEWSLQKDVDFWQAKIALTTSGSKEQLAVDTKYLAAKKALREQQFADLETATKKELDAAGQSHDAKIAILKNEAAQTLKIYNDQSKEYQDIQDKITAETKAAEAERRQIEEISAQTKIKLAQGELDSEEQAAKFRVEMGSETSAQLLAQERVLLQQSWQLQEQAYQQAIAAAAGNAVEQERLRKQQEIAEQAHQNKMTAIDQQATLQRTQIERTAINSISQDFARSLSQMMTLQKSFAQTIQSLWQGLVGMISNALASMIEKWLEKQLAAIFLSKAAQTASSKSTIASLAAQAGAAGVASMAAAPYPLDLGAPAFGAAMAAAAGTFSIASAAGGWDRVPYDGAMTELHRNEMVLPAHIASPLRSMIATGGINDNAASGALGGGDTHVHIHAADGDSVKKLFASEDGIAGMRNGLRRAVAGLKT